MCQEETQMATKYKKKLSSFCYQSNANINETCFPSVKGAERFLLADSTQPWHGCDQAGILRHHSWKH